LARLQDSDSSFLKRVTPALEALFASMTPSSQVFTSQEVIVEAGERPLGIYRIQSGWMVEKRLLADGRSHIRSFLLPGDCFGIRELISGKTNHSVVALTRATVAVLPRSRLKALLSNDPDFTLALIGLFAAAECRNRDLDTVLAYGNAIEKVAATLLDLCARIQRWYRMLELPVRLPIGQREIGEHLGLTLPHVSRTLRSLRLAATINIRYRALEVIDVAALAEHAKSLQDQVDAA
jgi:CRP-like cAMP-binding protein